MRTTLLAACVTAAALSLSAQSSTPAATDRPQFEVASVKQNKTADARVMMQIQPGGRLTATNIPLRFLIRNAYQVQDSELVGVPDWADTEHFDIIAKAEGNVAPTPPGSGPGPLQLMMQSLLAERFKLQVHRETRETPIYALVVARADGKLGPHLSQSTTDCQAMMANAMRGGAPPPPPAPGERPPCGMRMGFGEMSAGGFPLSQFAASLSSLVQRVVVDKTGLSGNFDFDLSWTPDQMPQRPGGAPEAPVDPNGPSLFTAVQEQLGLKLESQKDSIDVLVVDHVEQPIPD